MTPGKKRHGLKKWLSGLFPPKDEVYSLPDGPQRQHQSGTERLFNNAEGFVITDPTSVQEDNHTVINTHTPDSAQRHSGPGDFLNNAEGFVLHDPVMTSIQGNNNNTVINMQGTVTQIMSLLSQHIIHGAAHDDSAREPPPRCHPDTRIKLIARITAWFDGRAQDELLLWITGPAGVGKSAIVQTFAEYLAKSKSLGASVFISRPNKRNRPQGIFITIAYQLATRLEEYRNFIVERLSFDPTLLNKGLAAQFATFIVEPFVEKNIGAGGKRWGILLDGLDELDGEGAQRNIIQLISTFALEHRNVPLVWIIASRPESHISNAFDDDEVRRSCWSEHIPIDSTEACREVERFLTSSFGTIRKQFPHSVDGDWPSDTDFLKLAVAASGLFVYAEVVMQFIRDPDYADPISRFEALLSIIDRSNAIPTNENPFVHLDALYSAILSSIPATLWPTAKRLLFFTIHTGRISDLELSHVMAHFQTLRGVSILAGIPRHVIYACLNKCGSTLEIPDWKVAHMRSLTFLHASFSDYLEDSDRSGKFHVGKVQDVDQGVQLRLLGIWNRCSGDDIDTASVESEWNKYCRQLDDKAPSREAAEFQTSMFRGWVKFMRLMTYRILEMPVESFRYAQLRKVHMIKLCYYFDALDLMVFVSRLMESSSEFNDVGISRKAGLRDLKVGHLDLNEMIPAHVQYGSYGQSSRDAEWILHRPRSRAELQVFVSELESLQECSPELEVVVFGGIPKGRVAAFSRPLKELSEDEDSMFYVIPYPE